MSKFGLEHVVFCEKKKGRKKMGKNKEKREKIEKRRKKEQK